GLDANLRVACAERLAHMDFPGYAIGGFSGGGTPGQMYGVGEVNVAALPPKCPRYFIGGGPPPDLLEAIPRGIVPFDCVLPPCNGRNALAFTGHGPIRLRNLRYAHDPRPLEEGCACAACRHSRGYLRHLFLANEMLGPMLVSLHNVTFYQRLMAEARAAIERGRFSEFADEKLRSLRAMANAGPSSA